MSARVGAPLALLLLGLGLAGCATTPLEKREWIAVRTGHYDIWSSLGADETRRLAVELERFRGAVEYLWGSALPDEPVRTRVYAMDDRNMPRKFAYEHQRSFLLSRQRGDVIVLRTGGTWEDDAWTALKLEYARRLLWNASPDPLPPWLEEGLPQVASSITVRGNVAVVGTVRDEHVHTLREREWIPLERLLAAADLEGWSNRDREVFEAESWAVCHYLLLGVEHRSSAQAELGRFRELVRGGAAPAAAAREALAGPVQKTVYSHVVGNQYETAKLKMPLRSGGSLETRPVALPEVLIRLGELSLAIGEPAQARGYFERAIEREPGAAHALAGLGDALAAERDFAGAEERYRAALAAAPDDALVELGYANLLAAQARDAADSARRTQLAGAAREHYQKSRALAGSLPEADAGIAATYLLAGEDPAQGRGALRTARSALPGDAGLTHLDAQLAIAEGDSVAAHRAATLLVTRARSVSELESARALLDSIDVRAAIR